MSPLFSRYPILSGTRLTAPALAGRGVLSLVRRLAPDAARTGLCHAPGAVRTSLCHAPGAVRTGLSGIALLLCTAAPLSAQQASSIAGRVADPSGAPVARAQVVLLPSGRGTLADSTGRFILHNVPPGRHQLHVSRIGFAPIRLDVEVPAGGGVSGLAITMQPTPLSLPSVQVTGTASGRDPLAVAQATTHLHGAALQRELAGTIAHTLRAQPGIAMRSMGPAATMPVMRGLTGDRVLMLQDGLRSADLAGSADDHGVTMDPLSVERVEVIRGPATFLYGNNALGGVVNVITRDIPSVVPDEATWNASLQSESAFPGAAAFASTTLPLGGRWAVTARVGTRFSSDMRIPREADLGSRLHNTDMRSRSAGAGLGYVGASVTAGVATQIYDFAYGLPVPPDASPVSLDGRRYEARGQVEADLRSALFPSLRIGGTVQDYGHDELDDDLGEVLQQFSLSTQAADIVFRQGSAGPVVEGSWGISALFKDYSATGPSALTPGAASRGVGVFTFQAVSLGRPTLELGARLDDYRIRSRTSSRFGSGRTRAFRSFSGSAGLRVPLMQGVTAAASISRSFRAPTVEELFSDAAHAGTGAVETGNPGLAAERGVGAEALLRVQRARWNGQFSIHRQRIANYVHLQARGDKILNGARYPVLGYEQGTAVLQGLEGSLEWAPVSSVAIGVMGDMLHARQAGGRPLSFMPPARLGLTVRWDDGRHAIGGDVHHEFRQDRTGAADELPTPAHVLVRLHAGITFHAAGQRHSISLRAENLGNTLHRESTSRIKDFAPGPGRNVAVVWRVSG